MIRQSENPDDPNVQNPADDIEVASWLLEQLSFERKGAVSRAKIKAGLEEAVADSTIPLADAWSEWISDTCQGLGQRCRDLECSEQQLLDLALGGAQVITYSAARGWLAIAGNRRGQLLVLRPDHEPTSQWMSPASLGGMLTDGDNGQTMRCIVIEPAAAIPAAHGRSVLKPEHRLWELLKPEWPDIWIVIVYALVIGLLSLATPIAVETLVNTVAFGRFLQPIVVLSLMLLTVLAFSAAIRGLQTYVVEIIQRRIFVRIAADLAHRLPRLQPESLDGRSGRELVNRFFDVVVVQKVSAQLLLDGVLIVLGTLIGMALLAFYHPWLLGFDVMLLAMIAVIVFVLGRGAVKTSVKESKTKYHMAAWLEELAGCPTAFRYDGSARFALEHADHLISDYLTARGQHFRILMRQIAFSLATQAVASTVLLGMGGWLVISGQLTLGQLVAAELIVAVIVGSFAKFGKHMESFYDVLASVDKLGVLFDLPVERQDGLSSLASGTDSSVELRGVDYCLPSGRKILVNFNLSIQPEDRIAITGTSGSGKSTLLDLLFGLRRPTRGRMTINGLEFRELRPETLRSDVALVREIEAFEGSVAENVRVGRPKISTGDVRKALADVGLLEDILRLPNQLDTQLANSGHPLSSTQLRRLMLARGCAGKPGLLLVDGTLDSLPDDEALALAKWLCHPEHCWKLVLATGRETLAATCNRRVQLNRLSGEIASEP